MSYVPNYLMTPITEIKYLRFIWGLEVATSLSAQPGVLAKPEYTPFYLQTKSRDPAVRAVTWLLTLHKEARQKYSLTEP